MTTEATNLNVSQRNDIDLPSQIKIPIYLTQQETESNQVLPI